MTDNAIDAAVFGEMAETTGTEFAGELVGAFLDEAPVMIADLKDAIGQNDQDRFRRAAHSIKSNALIFGAHHLGALAREMELSVLPVSQTAPDQLAALDAAYAQAAARLKEMLDG
jgi:HPt (histidine-containing phosphotransfer) domain-containing protein